MTRNHGDLLYPQAICETPALLRVYRAEVRPATRWERLALWLRRVTAWRRR